MTKQFDLRIGLYETYEAVLCPISGRTIKGEHSTTSRIVGNYHFRYLNKLPKDLVAVSNVKQELLEIVLQHESAKKKVVTNDKQSK